MMTSVMAHKPFVAPPEWDLQNKAAKKSLVFNFCPYCEQDLQGLNAGATICFNCGKRLGLQGAAVEQA